MNTEYFSPPGRLNLLFEKEFLSWQKVERYQKQPLVVYVHLPKESLWVLEGNFLIWGWLKVMQGTPTPYLQEGSLVWWRDLLTEDRIRFEFVDGCGWVESPMEFGEFWPGID